MAVELHNTLKQIFRGGADPLRFVVVLYSQRMCGSTEYESQRGQPERQLRPVIMKATVRKKCEQYQKRLVFSMVPFSLLGM